MSEALRLALKEGGHAGPGQEDALVRADDCQGFLACPRADLISHSLHQQCFSDRS